ncbi:MAG: hypothetical protein AW07_04114 [Candidatus Accumulibacter sp. SK-11]|nr:MAG: hypothetical protein AW07_04114 [Candidatus Accumulibacter sp. SK-11]
MSRATAASQRRDDPALSISPSAIQKSERNAVQATKRRSACAQETNRIHVCLLILCSGVIVFMPTTGRSARRVTATINKHAVAGLVGEQSLTRSAATEHISSMLTR